MPRAHDRKSSDEARSGSRHHFLSILICVNTARQSHATHTVQSTFVTVMKYPTQNNFIKK